MAIIKSYPSGTLKLTDYLIASDLSTENATRNFKVSEVVNTILASLGIGTVTSISTSNSDFITLTGGPITTTGTLTSSLSASGTPSTLTYLRGDGTWSEPGPTPTDIYTQGNGIPLTTDTASWNFTGTGVVASATNNNVTIDIPGLLSTVDSVLDGTGITASGTTTTNPSTGDVTVTNAGATQLTAGNSVALSSTTGNITISTTANSGTVIAVNEGRGVDVTNTTTNAIVDVDYAGLDNYIRSQPDEGQEDNWTDTSGQNDVLSFNQLTSGVVKTAKFNSIPNTSLTSITSTVDTADDGKIKNIDTYTNVWKNTQVVTLTLSEYNSICPGVNCDNNTLYLILGAGTTFTVNLVYSGWTNVTLSSGGIAPASAYSILTEVDDGSGFVTASSITGIAGINYTFRTTITAINGYTLVSGPSGNTTSGTISANATETQTITAVLDPPPVSNCVVTLTISDETTGVGANQFTISGNQTGDQTTVPQGTQYTFSSTATANSNYRFNTGPFYSGFSDLAPSAPTHPATGRISGEILEITYSATITSVDQGNTLAVSGSGGTLSGANPQYTVTNNPQSGLSNGAGWSFAKPGISVAPNYDASAVTFSTDIGGSSTITFPYTGTISSADFSAVIYAQGTITYTAPPTTNEVTMNWVNVSLTDNTSAGYALSPLQSTSSNQVTIGSPYQVGSGTASVTLADAGQVFSSGGTPTANSSPGEPLSGVSMPALPARTSNWDVAGVIDWKTVNISVSATFTSNTTTYSVVFSYNGGSTTAVCTQSGVIYNNITTVPVFSGSSISFTVTRQGSEWCSSGFCPGGQLGSSPCTGSQYKCPTNVPQYAGGYSATLNGSPAQSGTLDRTWTSGSTVVSGSGGAITSLNQGDNIVITINE
jgi:hypothetical protein